MAEQIFDLSVTGVLLCEKDGWTQAVLVDQSGVETICDLDPETGLWSAKLMGPTRDGDHRPVSGLVDVPGIVDAMLGREVKR